MPFSVEDTTYSLIYTPTPLKNPKLRKNIGSTATASMTNPTPIIKGRKIANNAFPVEIP